MTKRSRNILNHYSLVWRNQPIIRRWTKGPVAALPSDFCILEFAPTSTRLMWTYATCAMSQPEDSGKLELHLFSHAQCELHVELLTVIAHYHRTASPLWLGHTVNFGRPWFEESECDHGLISLPYLDGPELECLGDVDSDQSTRFLWLIPITKQERTFKKAHGLEALEKRLEATKFNYLDPLRRSVV